MSVFRPLWTRYVRPAPAWAPTKPGALDVAASALPVTGAVSTTGDIQIGTSFDVAASSLSISGAATVTGDIQASSPVTLDIVASALSITGSIATAGDVQIGTGFDLAASPLAITGAVDVAGDVGSGTAPVGGGGESTPSRRRRYIVRRGNQLLVFADKAKADALQRAIDKAEAEARQAVDRAKGTSNRAVRRAKATAQRTADTLLADLLQQAQPDDVADLREAQALAQVYHQQQAMAEAIRLRDYEAAVRMWQDLRDEEEDDIAALLELA